EDLNLVAADDDVLFVEADFAVEFAMDRVPLEKMRECFGVGEIVDCANVADLFLRHRAQDVATDASEAVDSVISHKKSYRVNRKRSTLNAQRSTSNSESLGVES